MHLRILLLTIAYLPLFPNISHTEVIQTTDGRTIELKKDGTYEILIKTSNNSEYLKIDSHLFRTRSGEYGGKFIDFMPIFKNAHSKSIIAVKFSSIFYDAFGEEIFRFNKGSSDEKIRNGKKCLSKLFYVFKDNQFINGEPYDKLLSIATNKTGKIVTKINAIVLEGGKVVKF